MKSSKTQLRIGLRLSKVYFKQSLTFISMNRVYKDDSIHYSGSVIRQPYISSIVKTFFVTIICYLQVLTLKNFSAKLVNNADTRERICL